MKIEQIYITMSISISILKSIFCTSSIISTTNEKNVNSFYKCSSKTIQNSEAIYSIKTSIRKNQIMKNRKVTWSVHMTPNTYHSWTVSGKAIHFTWSLVCQRRITRFIKAQSSHGVSMARSNCWKAPTCENLLTQEDFSSHSLHSWRSKIDLWKKNFWIV